MIRMSSTANPARPAMSGAPNEIKPCPFCGGPAAVEEIVDDLGARFSVGCSANELDCMGYQSLTTFARRSEAIEAWNKRANSTDSHE